MEKFEWYLIALRHLGLIGLLRLQIQKIRFRLLKPSKLAKLTSKYAKYPLYCRPHTSDLNVFHQIFVDREYRCLDHIDSAVFIVDCGANVGYSAAYMLTAFPDARILAVEPDDENLLILEKNLAPYGNRVTTKRAAIWSHNTELTFTNETLGSGKEWGRQVREIGQSGDTTINAIDLNTLLRQSEFERISILKMDIEGAEVTVFGDNYSEWLAKVDIIVIELHGQQCEDVFNSAISNQHFKISTCDELTVCERNHHKFGSDL